MQLDALDGALLEGVPVRRQVAVAECGQRGYRFGQPLLAAARRLAVVLHEVDDADPGRQFDQPLLEPKQQIVDLGGFGFGLRLGDRPEREKCCLP